MRKAMLTRWVPLLVVMAGLALTGCGSDSPATTPAAYEGQWSREGMGTTILNLRSDGAFSRISWDGPVGSPLFYAFKGMYSFTPDAVGDHTHGTINLHLTHGYNATTDIWELSVIDEQFHCVIDTTASPKTIAEDEVLNVYQYYGAQVEIPETL